MIKAKSSTAKNPPPWSGTLGPFVVSAGTPLEFENRKTHSDFPNSPAAILTIGDSFSSFRRDPAAVPCTITLGRLEIERRDVRDPCARTLFAKGFFPSEQAALLYLDEIAAYARHEGLGEITVFVRFMDIDATAQRKK